jgi:hypothetical protein
MKPGPQTIYLPFDPPPPTAASAIPQKESGVLSLQQWKLIMLLVTEAHDREVESSFLAAVLDFGDMGHRWLRWDWVDGRVEV